MISDLKQVGVFVLMLLYTLDEFYLSTISDYLIHTMHTNKYMCIDF